MIDRVLADVALAYVESPTMEQFERMADELNLRPKVLARAFSQLAASGEGGYQMRAQLAVNALGAAIAAAEIERRRHEDEEDAA